MFLSKQNGVPVRNSDLLKNMIDCGIIKWIEQNCYEELMLNIFFGCCSKKAEKYWINWIARCYLLFKNHQNPECAQSQIFLRSDTSITKSIRSNLSEFNPVEEELEAFDTVFVNFIEFIKSLNEGFPLNPTQMFTLFSHLCDRSCDKEILKTHMNYFSIQGQPKCYDKLWEGKGLSAQRIQYFDDCITDLRDMTTPALPRDDRQTQPMKDKVWEKCVNGKCCICERTDIEKDNFEVGHIKARAIGGQVELDNLLPMCFDCNRSMGIQNAFRYKRDRYPQHLDIENEDVDIENEDVDIENEDEENEDEENI